MAKATPEQKAFLQSLDINPPKTRGETSSLIAYLKEGNGAGDAETLEDRISLFENIKAEFVGLVALPISGDGVPIEVLAIVPKTAGRVAMDKTERKKGEPPVSPFHCLFVRAGEIAKEGIVQLGDLGNYYIGDQSGEVRNLGWEDL